MFSTPGVERGCGTRVEGGTYLETASGPGGLPLELFVCDPPRPFTTDVKIGVQLVERVEADGVTVVHVVDWIGSEHYPYPADFIEEGRRFGFSRRVSPGLDFGRLSRRSRLLVVHARGLVTNRADALGFGSPERAAPPGVCLPPLGACAHFVASGDADPSHWTDDSPDGIGRGPCSRFGLADAEPTHATVANGRSTAGAGVTVVRQPDETAGEFVARVRETAAVLRGTVNREAPVGGHTFQRRHGSVVFDVYPPAAYADGLVGRPTDRGAPAAADVRPLDAVPALVAVLPIGGFTVVAGDDSDRTLARVAASLDAGGNAFDVEETEA